jgi:thiol-disulfide isomerase/thioredoxin
MKRLLLFAIGISLLSACGQDRPESTTDQSVIGLWRGVLSIQDQELPFNFRIAPAKDDSLLLTLLNGEEQLQAGSVQATGDSVVVSMHIFDTQILAKFSGEGELSGNFVKNYVDNYTIPFRATRGETYRFRENEQETEPQNFAGRWQVNFKGENGQDTTYNAVGEFEQKAGSIKGTFLTPLGDYRYMEGRVYGNEFAISAFDGEHAFLMKASLGQTDTLKGTFWSGKSWKEEWTAVRNDSASLPSPDSLTFLKEGYDKLAFTFPNLENRPVSLTDAQYENKVVIVQLLGSWCPNCMDETRFLADWYQRNQNKPVEIIGLAYEKKADFDYAKSRLEKLKENLGVEYELLVAGTADKAAAARTLPMLNHVLAFPTTIFIDKQGKVRKIHTGFSGPGTGAHYSKFIEDFDLFVDKLVNEE